MASPRRKQHQQDLICPQESGIPPRRELPQGVCLNVFHSNFRVRVNPSGVTSTTGTV
ncbi:hypothetical protein PUN28_014940 [Cardiocondyla obscurior]|uniref:Uncharacterized protein n=1 Tax=Cardiocondyla obscurior TaxID=286306 RepID=A0AAW2EZY5_9HYME